jgi:uncharacterized membrane protein YGL010W
MGATRSAGFFEWKRRMGVHEAYHRDAINRVVHWVCIPLELFAVVKLLTLVPIGPMNAGLVAVCLVAPVYLLTDALMGAAMVAILGAFAWSAPLVLPSHPFLAAGAAVVLFALTFGAQVGIGHRVYESGRDDTEKNIAELRRTKNPIPILLVFYYHLVELFLASGYRPALARDIHAFTERELASWNELGAQN